MLRLRRRSKANGPEAVAPQLAARFNPPLQPQVIDTGGRRGIPVKVNRR